MRDCIGIDGTGMVYNTKKLINAMLIRYVARRHLVREKQHDLQKT